MMAHLAGIDKGPVLDWTDDNGIMEHYRIWKKCVEILFCGPLNTAGDAVKCNYLIYWAGETGMDLVDKWETEGKLTDVNRNNIDRYLKLFVEPSNDTYDVPQVVDLGGGAGPPLPLIF